MNLNEFLGDYLEHCEEPLVFDGVLDWPMLKWDLKKWNDILGDELMDFRCGKVAYTKDPQWESSTEMIQGTFKTFLNFGTVEKWLYFDYKHLQEWFLEKPEIRDQISWTKFGVRRKTAKDSTIWIGSKGAHTSCHVDTYGFNLVAQVFGKKRWILFPPDAKLPKTRIPYEESSIYSKINFYSPDYRQCKDLGGQCRSLVLEAGQALFVPNGWWHYVENLENAIAVNIWLPLPGDHEKRINESITKLLIHSLAANLNTDDKLHILNPNENLEEISVHENINILKTCLDIYRKSECMRKPNFDFAEFLEKYKKVVKVVPVLSEGEFEDLMRKQIERFDVVETAKRPKIENGEDLVNIVNAIVDCEVVELIKKKLMET